jgi:hypothetical protein
VPEPLPRPFRMVKRVAAGVDVTPVGGPKSWSRFVTYAPSPRS